jgi:hypothetical protein
MKKTDWLILALIIIIGLFTLRDLFRPEFYTSHDGTHQVVRLYYFDQLIKEGQIPPRYVGGLYNGFGYPLFSFSYQMPWLIAEPLMLFGLSVTDSIEGTFIITYILSGITMYLFTRKLFGRKGAVMSSVIYLFAPNRFLNIFVRAAIGDATAYIFPPIIFLSLFMLKKQNKIDWRYIALGSIALGCLILSHAMIFMFFYMGILLYSLYSLILIKDRKKLVLNYLLLNLFGFAVAAYYFVPSLVDRNLTLFADIMGPAFVGSTFITLKELLYSTWGYGMMRATEGAMSFQVGLAQWLVFVLIIPVILWIIIKHKFHKDKLPLFCEVFFFLLLFIVSIIIMLPISQLFWNVIRNIAIVDFTWRILPLTVFSISVLAGFLIWYFKRTGLFILILISLLAVYSNRNHLRINKPQDWSIPFYLELERTTNDADEYTPKWAPKHLMKKKVDPKLQYTDNAAAITLHHNRSNYLDATVVASKSGQVKINTVYYPGWSVYVDGKKVPLNYENSGFMEIKLDPGKYYVEAKFGETPFRLFSDSLSLISLGFLGVMAFRQRKK